MAIKDLQARQGNIDIVVDIVDKEEPREFEKFGKKGKVCNATAKDSTGKIKLTLWNEQADEVKKGDSVHIINGWVGEYQGELQLTTGKFGKLEVLKGKEKAATEDEEVEKEIVNKDVKDAGEKVLTEDEKEEEELQELNKPEEDIEEDVTEEEIIEEEMEEEK